MFAQYVIIKMPGHWLLARLGKKVLRPGGLPLTDRLLKELSINDHDTVVEFAPGIGATASKILLQHPKKYYGIDQSMEAIGALARRFGCTNFRFIQSNAVSVNLPDACATKVIGEAMLTMQKNARKQQIINEACRLLKLGGKFAIHEISLEPETILHEKRQELCREAF